MSLTIEKNLTGFWREFCPRGTKVDLVKRGVKCVRTFSWSDAAWSVVSANHLRQRPVPYPSRLLDTNLDKRGTCFAVRGPLQSEFFTLNSFFTGPIYHIKALIRFHSSVNDRLWWSCHSLSVNIEFKPRVTGSAIKVLAVGWPWYSLTSSLKMNIS